MNKTNKSIGWAQYTLNLITGCLNGCEYCYARKLANTRLKEIYLRNRILPPYHFSDSEFTSKRIASRVRGWAELDPFYPRLWPDRFTVKGIPEGSTIFLNDMSDWVGIGIPEEWTQKVLDFIKAHPNHTFLTLTKQPQNLPKFSPFPENCRVGVTATNSDMFDNAFRHLMQIQARVKYISFEPLLDWTPTINLERTLKEINWLIIGSCTGTKVEMSELVRKYPDLTLTQYGNKWTAQPKIEWVQEIIEAADKAGIPVFLKDNLKPLLPYSWFWIKPSCDWAYSTKSGGVVLRQELPK